MVWWPRRVSRARAVRHAALTCLDTENLCCHNKQSNLHKCYDVDMTSSIEQLRDFMSFLMVRWVSWSEHAWVTPPRPRLGVMRMLLWSGQVWDEWDHHDPPTCDVMLSNLLLCKSKTKSNNISCWMLQFIQCLDQTIRQHKGKECSHKKHKAMKTPTLRSLFLSWEPGQIIPRHGAVKCSRSQQFCHHVVCRAVIQNILLTPWGQTGEMYCEKLFITNQDYVTSRSRVAFDGQWRLFLVKIRKYFLIFAYNHNNRKISNVGPYFCWGGMDRDETFVTTLVTNHNTGG